MKRRKTKEGQVDPGKFYFSRLGKRGMLLSLFIVFGVSLWGQNSINGQKFHSMNMDAGPSLEFRQDRFTYFPWIERYEFRTETHDFYPDEQEYTFRLTPSTVFKRKRQKELLNHLKSKPHFEWEETMCSLNERLHKDWLELYLNQREEAILLKKNKVLQEKAAYLEEMKKTLLFNASDLVKIEIALNDSKVKKKALNRKTRELMEVYQLDEMELDFSEFPDIEELLLYLDAMPLPKTFAEKKTSYEYVQAEKEIALEKVEKRQFFDFIQMKYNGPHEELWREKVSLGLGLVLPHSGNRKIKIRELEMEKEDLLEEMKMEEWKQERKIKKLWTILQTRLDEYLYLEKTYRSENNKLASLEKKLLQQEDVDLELIYEIRNRNIDNEFSLLNKEQDLYEKIIEYLEEAEFFCSSPYTFYLDRIF